MITKKEVLVKSEFLLALRTIMETYEEIAASRMQNIRNSVLQSRNFVLEVNSIFQEVKSSYKKDLVTLMKKKKIKDSLKLSFINRNGKTLFVYLSSNTGLYGDIIRKTFALFAEQFKREKADAAIIGRVGYQQFSQEFTKVPFTYFDLPDDKIDSQALAKIISFLIQYDKIVVFYGQFRNVVLQEPLMLNISGDLLPSSKSDAQIKYFFEPTLEKILEFFEKEIFGSIFQQIVLEAQLAKFASRMVALDEASNNIKNKLKETIFQKERVLHQDRNKKQIQTLASISLWETKYG